MFDLNKIVEPVLGLQGLEADLTEEERAIQEAAHGFARDVMRPLGATLDKMTAEEVVAPGSPLFEYLRQVHESGLLDLAAIAGMDNQQKARIMPIIFEELGWGDSGLAIAALASSFPAFAAHNTGDAEIIERFGSLPGCWLATQPDRGSDAADMDGSIVQPGTRQSRGNLYARVVGDEVIVQGQSSAWVSYAPLAQTALAYIPCDYGQGLEHENGRGLNHIGILIPLDLPGVSKGKPLEKLGQRPLPQGELFFNEVHVPKKYVIAEGDAAITSFLSALTFGNMEMAATFTGVARAAYEHALAYVHERKQGGTPIINHQSVQLRTFDLWQKVELSRAITQRVFAYNYSDKGPHLAASITSKTYVTETAFQVASEALQLFGGNGLTCEYPIEKLLRDARASMIEDGETNTLKLKAMHWLSRAYQRNH
ncbi:acyl-CoA dehydrogenase family protein [Pseudomonas sp. LFM046]|uniref:acyl-CoA dehydrogenase family protein n=1 Tax=Pseudomonas sp. LFM046 TaxID=1608357 RepID=UPI0005CFE5C9|nr:acyl-CoA dehydrogenase family protein [Pseudomonas sp. LFM046]